MRRAKHSNTFGFQTLSLRPQSGDSVLSGGGSLLPEEWLNHMWCWEVLLDKPVQHNLKLSQLFKVFPSKTKEVIKQSCKTFVVCWWQCEVCPSALRAHAVSSMFEVEQGQSAPAFVNITTNMWINSCFNTIGHSVCCTFHSHEWTDKNPLFIQLLESQQALTRFTVL